jgi:tetratricopeptide (TPR) repeat protein
MEAWVGRQGMSTASTRCYATLGELAYAPITAWLRSETLQSTLASLDSAWLSEIARLLPEILTKRPKLPRPLPLTESLQTLQFFEALAGTVLAARQPLLLVLDDMQWCDRETLEWLHYLIRFESEARLLLIGTVRSEETRPDHPLVAFLSTLQRDGLVTEIVPGPLTAAETTILAEYILGRELDTTHSATLYAETEGNPLFVVEMARAGTVTAASSAPAEASHPLPLLTQSASTLPPVLQSVLAARLAQLSPLAQEIANVAATIGREFTFAILARASREPEESVVRGLDELWQRRMVREQGGTLAETYDFSHDRLREQIYASLSPAHRRLLHRHIAEAFKVVHAPNLAPVSGQIAAHYERAGQPVQAIPYYQQAGEVARQIYAHLEAIRAFERAAALLTSSAPGQIDQDETRQNTARIQETIGDISLDIGHYQEARQAYQAARALLPEQERLWQARLLWKSARAWNYVSNNPHDAFHTSAREAFQQAEQILASSADPANPAWRQEWIDLHTAQIWPLRGTADDMTAAIEKMRPAIEQHGTEEQRKLLADAIGMRNGVRSRFGFSEEALAERRKALAEVLPGGDKGQIGTAHMALGILLIFAGHLDEAEEHLREALHIGEQAGIAWMQTRCLTFLPLIFRKRGQVAQVRELLDRAQAIGADQHNNVLQGHRAWVAWREGNLAEAECAGQAAIAHDPQQPDINPFQWIGAWPLLGVALVQSKSAAAIELARLLLAPTQQPQPAPLKVLLEAALLAWNAGQPEKAHEMLQQAVPVAREMGYL